MPNQDERNGWKGGRKMIDQYLKEVEEDNNSVQTPYEYCPDIPKLTKMLRKAIDGLEWLSEGITDEGVDMVAEDLEADAAEILTELNEMCKELDDES